jgi:GH24 family phage-related lysozyme (muramidase)
MADLFKVLHHLDILKCNHGAVVEVYTTVLDRRSEIEDDLHILTDQDLLKRCYVQACPSGCRKIVSITLGYSKDLVLKDDAIPLLGNLEAVTDKQGIVKWDNSLSSQLAEEEGRYHKMYLDSVKVQTIGQGFNLKKDGAQRRIEALGLDYQKVFDGTQTIDDSQIDTLFADDTTIAQTSARKEFPGFDSMSEARQNALTDGTFNLGSFTNFPKFKAYMNAGDYKSAARELAVGADGKSKSKWLTQVGKRAERIIAQIRGDEVYAAPR